MRLTSPRCRSLLHRMARDCEMGAAAGAPALVKRLAGGPRVALVNTIGDAASQYLSATATRGLYQAKHARSAGEAARGLAEARRHIARVLRLVDAALYDLGHGA